MNELEMALLDLNDETLDLYLEITPTRNIRADILEIKTKAMLSTTDGALKMKIQKY